jgi:hypothetical protein
MPAVDPRRHSGHERSCVGDKQQQRSVEFAELAETALRRPLDERLAWLAFEEIIVKFDGNISGGQRVDANAVAPTGSNS